MLISTRTHTTASPTFSSPLRFLSLFSLLSLRVTLVQLVTLAALVTLPSPADARQKPSKKPEISLDSVSNPTDQEVCFSPNEPCDLKLIKFIQSAKESIDIAIYDINRDQLVHHLLIASKRIPVRVLVDKRQSKGEHSLVPLMIKAGVPLRYGRQRGIMHNKFTIIDGKRIETGSFNYTNHAAEANNENQVYLSNPAVVDRYKKQFNQIWSEGIAP